MATSPLPAAVERRAPSVQNVFFVRTFTQVDDAEMDAGGFLRECVKRKILPPQQVVERVCKVD